MKGVKDKATLILRFTKDAPHELRATEFRLNKESNPIKKTPCGIAPDFPWKKSAMSLFHCLVRYAGNPPGKNQSYTHPKDADMFDTLCQTLNRPDKLHDIFGEISDDASGNKHVKVLTAKIFDAPNPTENRQVRIRSEFLPTANIGIWYCEKPKKSRDEEWVDLTKITAKSALDELAEDIVNQFKDCPTRGKHRNEDADGTVSLIPTKSSLQEPSVDAPVDPLAQNPASIHPTKPTPPAIAEKRDRKNIIIDDRISELLLAGQPPSLLRCVEATEMRWLLRDEKNYNHLFGISTVIFVKLPTREQSVLLWYPRRSRAGLPEAREGWSILFHASFTRDFPGEPQPADLWVASANGNRERGRKEFVHIPGGTLHKLIEYKIKIPQEVEGTCQPLGVISRDLRESDPENPRVYTQYVFQTMLHLPNVTTMDELNPLVTSFTPPEGNPVSPCDEDLEPEFFLSPPSDLTMDYLALCAVPGKEGTLACRDSRFTRNFKIV